MPTRRTLDPDRQLREALAPYVDLKRLRTLAAAGADLRPACSAPVPDALPAEVTLLLDALSALLRPPRDERIRGPEDVAALLMVEMSGLEQEELRAILLTTRSHVIDIITLYRGTINSSLVRTAEVFKAAIRRNAARLIVAHNHPSGDAEPSPQDRALTQELVAAGQLLDIEVVDHLVIGRGRWVSLRQRTSWP